MADGKLIFETAIDKSGFEKDAAKLKGTAADAGASIQDVIAGSLTGNLLGSVLKDAVSGLVDVGKSAITAASDLLEVQNVVDVTFGRGAAQVDTWAAAAREQYGLTELKAKQYASTLGAMLKSMGMTSEKTLEMSTAMAGLAADMASFYNLDFDTAFEKIRAGISGETEPLKQLGINMSVANMEAFALSRGVTKAYQSMTQAEQATLRYYYLMQTTADAQGDFARTSDGLANGLRLVETNWNALLANVGERLEPLARSAVGLLNTVLEGLNGGGQKTADFNGTLKKTVTEIETQAAVAGHLAGRLEALGDYSSLTAEKQGEWKAIAGELIRLVPELSGEIDVQNGSFQNGIGAIYDHIEALKEEAKAQAVLETRRSILQEAVTANENYYAKIAEHEVAYARYLEAEKAMAEKEAEIREKYSVEGGSALEAKWSNALNRPSLTFAHTGNEIEQDIAQWRELTAAYAEARDESYRLYGEREKLGEQAAQTTETANAEIEALEAYAGSIGVSTSAAAEGAENLAGAAGSVAEAMAQLEDPAENVKKSLEELSQYRLENLAQVRRELDGTFDLFEKPGRVRKRNLKRDTQNMEQQAEYWERYNEAVTALQEREGGDAWVAELADGSEESLAKLEALASASEDAYGKATAAKEQAQANMDAAAEAVSQSQLEVDSAYQELEKSAADAVAAMNMQGEAFSSASSTAQGLIDGLNAKAPGLSLAVSRLNQIMGRLGQGGAGGTAFMGAPKLATGLAYVPYNEFPALLHEGEAVLTKAEAGLWRAGWAGARSAAAAGAPQQAASGGAFQQVNNFNMPVQTPDEFAKTMRLYATYGLEGAI